MFRKVTNYFSILQTCGLFALRRSPLLNLLFAIIVPFAQVDPDPQSVQRIEEVEGVFHNVNR